MYDSDEDDQRRRARAPREAGPSHPAWSPPAGDRPPVGEPLVTSRRGRGRGDEGRPSRPGGAGDDPTGDARTGAGPAPVEDSEPAGREAIPPFAGRSVLVTGAASSLGTALATAFAGAGAEVHLLDRDADALDEVAAGLPRGTRSLVLACDLGSVDEIRSVGEFLEHAEASPDVVVHAASVDEPGTVLGSPVADLDEHYLIGVRGPAALLQSIVPRLSPGATVVFAGPVGTHEPPDDGHRAVAAAARQQLVGALRAELAERGVTVMSAGTVGVADPDDVAAAVLDALVAERAVEVLDVTLRPRSGTAPEG
jgi:3-hydroxybutyrate dehydrogenase